jgi:hypothetical protein
MNDNIILDASTSGLFKYFVNQGKLRNLPQFGLRASYDAGEAISKPAKSQLLGSPD